MSRQLPAPFRNEQNNRSLVVPGGKDVAGSALVRLAVALTPDALRAAERLVARRAARQYPQQTVQSMPSRSVQLSEVEIDLEMPFVRRVIVRNATAWSTFPVEVPPARSGLRRAGRLIGMSGALALVAGVMLRRMMPSGRGRIIDIDTPRSR